MKKKWNQLTSLLLALVMVLSMALQVPMKAKAAETDASGFKGKVISIMGDSISTFDGWIPVADGFNEKHLARYPQSNLFDKVEYTWWHSLIYEKLGAKLGINDSWRGSTVTNIIDAEVDGNFGTKAAMASTTRIQNLGSNGTPDVILFYGGTNDLGKNRTIGNFDSITKPSVDNVNLTATKWDTVVEAYATALVRMHHYYPNAKILAMLPTYTSSYYSNSELASFNAELKKVVDYYDDYMSVDYVDLTECGIDTSYLPDGIHPNKGGMELIRDYVYSKLTTDDLYELADGEHVVYPVNHILSCVSATKSYYKTIDANKKFEETLKPDIVGTMDVTVTMNGTDITSSCYNSSNGKITINSVEGNVVIKATGPSTYSKYLQMLPDDMTKETNLWTALEPEFVYVNSSKEWQKNAVYSITFPVEEGYQIYANSMRESSGNDSTAEGSYATGAKDGIRITYFYADGTIKTIGPGTVCDEYKNNGGYIIVPKNVVAINVPMWVNNDNCEVYIRNYPEQQNPVMLEKTATLENDGSYAIDLSAFTTGKSTTQTVTSYVPLDIVVVLDASSSMLRYSKTQSLYSVSSKDADPVKVEVQGLPMDITETTNLWDMFEKDGGYFDGDHKWLETQGTYSITSITIPVEAGDHIKARSFQVQGTTKDESGSSGTNGIRITFFDKNGEPLESSYGPATVYNEYSENGYVKVPDKAVAVNIPMWVEDGLNWVYLVDNTPFDGTDSYNPKNDNDVNNMRIAILQDQIQDFAEQIYEEASDNNVNHKMSVVTFGGGDDDYKPSGQGYFHKFTSVNGLADSYMTGNKAAGSVERYTSLDAARDAGAYVAGVVAAIADGKDYYYFSNTGLFVDGVFKNYMNAEDPKTDDGYLYTPVFAGELSMAETYYYLTYDGKSPTTEPYGYFGDILSITYKNGAWYDVNNLQVTPMSAPYDSVNAVQFLSRTAEEVAVSPLGEEDYKNALMNVANTDGTMNNAVVNSVKRIVAKGGTDTKFGLEMAYKVLDANGVRTEKDAAGNDVEAKQIVVLFTDGDTDNKADNYKDVRNWATKIKETGADLYVVAVEDATVATSNSNWMKDVASSAEHFKYYDNMQDISSFFESVKSDQTTSRPTIVLDDTTVMQDTLNAGFVLPDTFVASDIVVKTQEVSYSGSEYVESTVVYEYEASTSEVTDGIVTTKYYCNNDSAGADEIVVTFEKETGKVKVTGFDYSENYVTTDHPGQKLIVSVKGVEATDAAVTDGVINTNQAVSGLIYTKPETGVTTVYDFISPVTQLTSDVYVLDYAKPLEIPFLSTGQSNVSYIDGDLSKFVGGTTTTEYRDDYGTLVKNSNGYTFTPTTMNWDGSADFYLFGQWDSTEKSKEITTGDNLWSKVSVIPANSIYYEDDFVTNESKGTVGIEYTGNWKPAGSTESNITADNSSNSVHGWEEALVDDTGFTGGSAHEGTYDSANMATARFTFTGTGVDVYARTNKDTGQVMAMLYKGNATKVSKVLIVDQLAKSGDYYQIPTLFFKDLEYGTYTVEIRVTKANSAATGSERLTYYLDGVRVYNPLADDSAYAEDEQDAVFTRVRDILLDSKSFKSDSTTETGAVFIDEVPAGENTTDVYVETEDVIGTYEDYGPKNEVYLNAGQAVVLKVKSAGTYYVGMKSPTGEKVNVEMFSSDTTKGTFEISHTSDLYYKVTVGNINTSDGTGYIVIKNINAVKAEAYNPAILSLTMLKTTQMNGENGIVDITPQAAVRMMFSMRSMSVADIPVEPEVPDTSVDVEVNNPDTNGATEEIIADLYEMIQTLFTDVNTWMKKVNY